MPGPDRHRPDYKYKRLIVACDGTWVNANETKVGADGIPSNVTRLFRSIRNVSSDGIPQIRLYHAGIGTRGGRIERVYDGATGEGLDEDIREGYVFLTSNYIGGDEIFLLGFSRGAYTARAIAGLIGDVGILTRRGMRYFGDIYADVQHQHDPKYVSKSPDRPFRNKPSFRDPLYMRELVRLGMTVPDVPIRAVGVWDTVGALGAPRLGWVEKVGLQSPTTKKMSFYDTRLSNCIHFAFQALALDEKRAAFTPAVWEKPAGNRTKLRQVWFPGVHSNIGGPGYPDQGMANITLAWMMSCLLPHLDLDTSLLFEEQSLTVAYYESEFGHVRPWAMGEIYNSSTGLYALAGSEHRTPGAYRVVDPATERETDTPLRDTHEFIHPSARVRTLLRGRGTGDRGVYDSEVLRDRVMVIRRTGREERRMFWRYLPPDGRADTTEEWLEECPLLPLETQMLLRCGNGLVSDLALKPEQSDRIVDAWFGQGRGHGHAHGHGQGKR